MCQTVVGMFMPYFCNSLPSSVSKLWLAKIDLKVVENYGSNFPPISWKYIHTCCCYACNTPNFQSLINGYKLSYWDNVRIFNLQCTKVWSKWSVKISFSFPHIEHKFIELTQRAFLQMKLFKLQASGENI